MSILLFKQIYLHRGQNIVLCRDLFSVYGTFVGGPVWGLWHVLWRGPVWGLWHVLWRDLFGVMARFVEGPVWGLWHVLCRDLFSVYGTFVGGPVCGL